MKRRPAVTLLEVLIAMFIMAIGMLALLVLFPVGAVSMAQALKDDRCAYASAVAENVSIATNVRYGDPIVSGFVNGVPTGTGFTNPFAFVSGLVYVDPYGVQGLLGNLGGVIPRVSPSFVGGSQPLADRWFSLQDDITFSQNGIPDTSNSGGFLDRGRRYSYAYLLRRMPPYSQQLFNGGFASDYTVHLDAVVYNGRPVNSLVTPPTEWPYVATVMPPPPPAPALPPPTNGLQLITPTPTTAKRGGWILDSTTGIFYRITNIAEVGGTTTLETQQNLQLLPGQTTMNILIMDYVAEVFDKGFGWQQ